MNHPAPHEGSGRRRLAIVGTGIAGMVVARLLHRHHDLTIPFAERYTADWQVLLAKPLNRRASVLPEMAAPETAAIHQRAVA